MVKLLSAILFCMAFQPALAGTGPAGAGPAQVAHATAQVKLVASADPAAMAAARPAAQAAVTGLPDEAPPPTEGESSRRTDHGMLLAALALMAGIVLRRWGAGQR